MRKVYTRLIVGLLLLSPLAQTRAESSESYSSVSRMTIGVGYNEGVSGKVFLIPELAAYLGVGYSVVGADTILRRPLHSLKTKLGVEYLLAAPGSRLRINLFLEAMEEWEQFALAYDQVGKNKNRNDEVYNVWSTHVRLGLAPEIFITPFVSIGYRFGAQATYHGTHYQFNADGSDLESKESDHFSGGVFGHDTKAPILLHNMSFTLYFKK